MSTPARRTARLAALVAALGAAAVCSAAPAAAAPAQADPFERCSAPLDGVSVCTVTEFDPAVGYSFIHAELRADPSAYIVAGLVSVDACSAACRPKESAAGEQTNLLATERVAVGKGTGAYLANATWVDAAGNRHVGVTV